MVETFSSVIATLTLSNLITISLPSLILSFFVYLALRKFLDKLVREIDKFRKDMPNLILSINKEIIKQNVIHRALDDREKYRLIKSDEDKKNKNG